MIHKKKCSSTIVTDKEDGKKINSFTYIQFTYSFTYLIWI